MSRFTFRVASPSDDADIRRLLRENPFPGAISLSFEREPNAALAAGIEGDVCQTIVAREAVTGVIAGITQRSVRDAFIDGRPARCGYFGQLRVGHAFRRRRGLLLEGVAFGRTLHEQGDARLYLANVVADNDDARRLLAHRPVAGLRFTPVGGLTTLAIPVGRGPGARLTARAGDVRTARGTDAMIEDVAACLWRNGQRYQFAPCWTAADLRSPVRVRGLRPEDFTVVRSGHRVIGCLACWDQRAFKQAVVRGYGSALGRVRPLVNLLSPLTGAPVLPPAGTCLDHAYLSHFAVDDDREDVCAALLSGAVRHAQHAGLDHVVIAFSEGHPLLRTVARACRHRAYASVLHVVHWPDGEDAVRAVDARVPHPEVAVL